MLVLSHLVCFQWEDLGVFHLDRGVNFKVLGGDEEACKGCALVDEANEGWYRDRGGEGWMEIEVFYS